MASKNNTPIKNKVILCGFGHIGKSVFELLSQFHFDIYVVSNSPIDPDFINENSKNVTFIQGDARNDEILKKAHVTEAEAIFALTDNDLVNLSIAIDAKKLNNKIHIAIRMFDFELGESLKKDLGIQEIFSATHLSAPYFIPNAYSYPRIGELDLENKIYSLHFNDDMNHSILNDSIVKTSLNEGYLLIQEIEKNKKPNRWLHLFGIFHYKTTFSFKIIFSFFFFVVTFSTFIISKEMNLSLLDALYFTVTTITTVGYGDHNFSQASSAMKTYGIFLMFFGTALLASLFSLITDLIITEKFKNFFGTYLIPKKNHHVLIGTGNIGTRIAEILIKNLEPTVLIESDKTGKFSEDIRRQLPVVEGNPKNLETLIQANIKTAKSIICVTENDVDNLSIIQKAKSINPKIATEMSIFDKEMAVKLKKSLNEESIISSPLIAANYFMASLFFEGVLFAASFKNSLIIICDKNKWKPRSSFNDERMYLRTDLNLKGKDLSIIEVLLN